MITYTESIDELKRKSESALLIYRTLKPLGYNVSNGVYKVTVGDKVYFAESMVEAEEAERLMNNDINPNTLSQKAITVWKRNEKWTK